MGLGSLAFLPFIPTKYHFRFLYFADLLSPFCNHNQGCCLMVAWGALVASVGDQRFCTRKVLYKEPERAPNFITKAIVPNFLVNYIPVAGHNTVKVLMYLASVSTRETCKNSQTIST